MRFNRLLVAVAAAAAAAGTQAAPLFVTGENEIQFENAENAYRPATACGTRPVNGVVVQECLAAAPGDPNGYRRINPLLAGNIKQGDVFVGVFRVQNINSPLGGDAHWETASGDRFTGYFAQEVAAISSTINPDGTIPTRITFANPSTDPFGILSTGEMFRFYTGGNPNASTQGCQAFGGAAADVRCSIESATGIDLASEVNYSKTFWGSLGIGPEGYGYTLTDFSAIIGAELQITSFLGLDLITEGPSYNAGTLAKVNDITETLVGGGTTTDPFVCTAAMLADPAVKCNDMVGAAKISKQDNFVGYGGQSTSPWMFASDDPIQLSRIPEPGSLALVGLALAGLGLMRRRVS